MSAPFIFIDNNSKPFLVYRGWLYYWNEGSKNWVTLRKMRRVDYGIFKERRIPDDQAKLYGFPMEDK